MLRSFIAVAMLVALSTAVFAGPRDMPVNNCNAPVCDGMTITASPLAPIGRAIAVVDSGVVALVDAAAFAAGVPSHIAHGVIRTESNYNPRLRGRAGEYGIGQIKCQTARSVGFAGDCSRLFDAATNLTYSMRYLRLALDRGGQGCAGASLYQRGIYGRAGCSGYGRMVMARAGR